MYDHVGLHVRDLDRAQRFYRAALEPLGLVADESGIGFGPKGAPALWLHINARAEGGAHVALRAADRRAVDRFHAQGLKAGGRDNGPPGPRNDYSPTYYAAFLIDPDGNNIEAVCHS